MSTNQTTEKKSNPAGGVVACIALGVVILIVIGAFSNSSSSSKSSSSGSNKSSMACTHFHNIVGDIKSGILTDSEIRTKISEVRDSAVDPAVEKAATHLLAGVTQNSEAVTELGFAELVKACS